MLANNETGTIQPIAEAAALCRRHGAWLHVDAVQAAGRIDIRLSSLGAHSMAISSHKLGGPPGAGALLLAPEVATIAPLIAGGGQERGRRGGTPPLPAIAGFAAAAAAATDASRLAPLRDAVEAAAVAAGAVVCGAGASRLANTTCLALPGVRADAQVIALDLDGIRGQRRRRMQFRQGDGEPRARRHGPGAAGRSGDPCLVALEREREADVAAFADAYHHMSDRLRATLAPRAA